MNTHRRNPLGVYLLGVALAAALLGPGCVSKSTKIETGNVSLGQQLEDLEKAHQKGTINDKEYKELRKSIIEKYK
jgi:hypothetical protein